MSPVFSVIWRSTRMAVETSTTLVLVPAARCPTHVDTNNLVVDGKNEAMFPVNADTPVTMIVIMPTRAT